MHARSIHGAARRFVIGVLGICTAGVPLHGQGNEKAKQDARAKNLWNGPIAPVVFSFSGGISLGAYQAGVNWVMTEFIKGTHYLDDSTAIANRLPALRLPNMSVTAMTGASAGNINVLLAAIEYCDKRLDQKAESSLFWEAWVRTGWDELFPDHRGPDPGALDRSASYIRIKGRVEAAMAQGTFDHGCRVPVGVVTTKVRAAEIALDKNVSYRTQRFAALFEVQEAAGHLQFVQPRRSLLEYGPLGAQLVLPASNGGLLDLDRKSVVE